MSKLTRWTHQAQVSGRPRITLSFSGLTALGLALAACLPAPVAAEGRYSRRQAARGEQTDTDAKLGTFAYINDRETTDRRLVLFVDAGPARNPLVPTLLPLRVGLSQRGRGEPLPLGPHRFRLSGARLDSGVAASSQDAVLARPRGRAAIGQALSSVAARHAPLPFEATDGLRVPTVFYSDPASGVFLNEDTELPASAWFSDLLLFELPPDLELFDERLVLAYLDEAGRSLVEVAFRVESDSQLNRTAFRRVKKARKRADAKARRAARRQAESEALGGPPPR